MHQPNRYKIAEREDHSLVILVKYIDYNIFITNSNDKDQMTLLIYACPLSDQ